MLKKTPPSVQGVNMEEEQETNAVFDGFFKMRSCICILDQMIYIRHTNLRIQHVSCVMWICGDFGASICQLHACQQPW